MKTVKERANAKINLYLDVLSKREDGFHDIKTVMHSVSFGDEITVNVKPSAQSSVRLTVEGNRFLPTDGRNLAVRAAYLFLEKAGLTADVEIRMVKRIPVAAGLAGGSTDAAAVLRALNKIFDKFFSIPALNAIASELGSDVVYCLYGRCALCEGRGELITKIKTRLDGLYTVIAISNEHMSTPTAYKALDVAFSDFDGTVISDGEGRFKSLINSLGENNVSADGLYNIFETAVLPMCPGATAIKARLLEEGAIAAMMSGSGPSVFGIFNTFEDSKRACMALRQAGFKAYYARMI
ncbi:MAG: 4-(cytidine 5'-diphospho)-2-C-methyl-D-erythritol kinase [Clostridia bacterium]|nr:4-(cytidine 5'-diphospho)-2-C-methyl-D-erythritol kinase [Clostridia bacterium]